LAIDLFVPQTAVNKPLLVYVHGGGFAGGERDHPNHIDFCEHFAKQGWVTATISYHLLMKGKSFSCDQAAANKITTFAESARNVNQAVAYLIKNADRYNIDPSKIVIAGSSAGAEAVINAGYWKKTQENILPANFKYAGIISMAGALIDENWITSESAVPTALFHGTCDNLVPYATASHHYCNPEQPGFLTLFGSYAIAKKLESIGRPYFMVTDCGAGHEWNEKPIRPEYSYLIEDFLQNDVLRKANRSSHQIFREGKLECAIGLEVCK
jgi:predicted esterase